MHPCVHGSVTTAKIWKQTKCLLINKWIKMWYISTIEYYSAIKRNKILPFATAWIDLEIIILSKLEKDKYHMTSLNVKSKKQKSMNKTETHR